jgi:hypothetical protein
MRSSMPAFELPRFTSIVEMLPATVRIDVQSIAETKVAAAQPKCNACFTPPDLHF